MKNQSLVSVFATTTVLCSGAFAFEAGGSEYFAWADVTGVEPVYRTVQIESPRQQCWDEQVYVQGNPTGRSITPEIVGAIIGAGVGHQFGSGRGQDLATAAGAVLGGSVGHDIKNRRAGQAGGHYQTVQKCQTVTDIHTEERSDGYQVSYVYDGRQYTTRTDSHPGDRLRVRVGVTPAE